MENTPRFIEYDAIRCFDRHPRLLGFQPVDITEKSNQDRVT